jgi:hypothetical protein
MIRWIAAVTVGGRREEIVDSELRSEEEARALCQRQANCLARAIPIRVPLSWIRDPETIGSLAIVGERTYRVFLKNTRTDRFSL